MIKFSDHSLKRSFERNIPLEEILLIINKAVDVLIIPSDRDKMIDLYFGRVKNKHILVVFNKKNKVIVTVRQMRKKEIVAFKRSLTMNKNVIDISYYENEDFSNLIRSSKNKKKYQSAKSKRITINISEDLYDEAHILDRYLNMGYQNVLKTAMILGLNNLLKDFKKSRLRLRKLTNRK